MGRKLSADEVMGLVDAGLAGLSTGVQGARDVLQPRQQAPDMTGLLILGGLGLGALILLTRKR